MQPASPQSVPSPGVEIPLHGVGVDVGGTGIKVGRVDLRSGTVLGERIYVHTPQPSTPEAVASTIADVLHDMDWQGPVGIAVPTVIYKGAAQIAHNIDDSWIGTNVADLFARYLPDNPVSLLNDADAAGITEAYYGSAAGAEGLTLLLTLGTGIGSALLWNGQLIPNSELGHLLVQSIDDPGVFDETEHLAAPSLREEKGWSIADWAKRISAVIEQIEELFWPRLIVLGGGISAKSDEWFPLLTNRTPVVAASRLNDAGLVGAAAYAAAHTGEFDIDSVYAAE